MMDETCEDSFVCYRILPMLMAVKVRRVGGWGPFGGGRSSSGRNDVAGSAEPTDK